MFQELKADPPFGQTVVRILRNEVQPNGNNKSPYNKLTYYGLIWLKNAYERIRSLIYRSYQLPLYLYEYEKGQLPRSQIEFYYKGGSIYQVIEPPLPSSPITSSQPKQANPVKDFLTQLGQFATHPLVGIGFPLIKEGVRLASSAYPRHDAYF